MTFTFQTFQILKLIVHPKWIILSAFAHHLVFPNQVWLSYFCGTYFFMRVSKRGQNFHFCANYTFRIYTGMWKTLTKFPFAWKICNFFFPCICHWQYMLKDLCVLPSSGNSVLKKKKERERVGETIRNFYRAQH